MSRTRGRKVRFESKAVIGPRRRAHIRYDRRCHAEADDRLAGWGARSVGGLEWSPAVFDAGILATIAGACLTQVSASWTYPHEPRAHDPPAPVHEAGVAVEKRAPRAVGDRTGFRSFGRTSHSNGGGGRSGRAANSYSQDSGDGWAAQGSSPLAASSALAACYNSRSAATAAMGRKRPAFLAGQSKLATH